MNVKLKLRFKDRIGIVADISTRIAENGLNIVSMEVVRKDREALVFVEVESGRRKVDRAELTQFLGNTADVIEIHGIGSLPHEERAERFRAVLDNISDGVISIDRNGRITTMNRVAGRAFMCDADDIVGERLDVLDLPGHALLRCLDGEKLEHVKQTLVNRKGRYQYISTCKPIHDAHGVIVGAVEIAKDIQGIKKLAQTITEPRQVGFGDIIGNHEAIQEAIAFAQKIAANDAAVALRGASGTGKELFARAIHTASGVKGPFIPVNCAALPEQLLESELFGYARGTFTGGRREGKPGLFEQAQDGTVFLDEIGEMPLGSQVKLLRVIQEKAVRRVGGTKEVSINARLITATNKNLERLVEEKRFRQDLYYRINVLPIHIPPLQQRPEDIPLLAEHFLFQLDSKLGKQAQRLSPGALEKLRRHHWPGNVRELKNVVNRAAIISEQAIIPQSCILYSHELGQSQGLSSEGAREDARSLKEQVAALEKRVVLAALDRKPSVRQAAKSLRISHPALLKKMRKYDIQTTRRVTYR